MGEVSQSHAVGARRNDPVAPATEIRAADAPEGLSAIHHPDCAAALWRRRPAPGFQSWLDGLDPALLPRTRTILRPHAVRDAMRCLCDLARTPDCPERARLTDDIAALSDLFARLMDAQWLRLRLDVVTTNACRFFHVDSVTARLVCTYRGAGTQYGVAPRGQEPERVFTTPTGAPILLRGAHWPGDRMTGLLHRSPPIEGAGETRLVLALDPVTDEAAAETAH